MKITANEEYGLRIILRVARLLSNGVDLVSLHDIAEAEGISVENTAAILSHLRESQLIESVRGKYGGYRLAKTPAQINLYEIINALSKGTFDFDFCNSHTGLMDACVHNSDCSVRSVWSNLTKLINNFLASITLEQLMQDETSSGTGIHSHFQILQDFTERNLQGCQ